MNALFAMTYVSTFKGKVSLYIIDDNIALAMTRYYTVNNINRSRKSCLDSLQCKRWIQIYAQSRKNVWIFQWDVNPKIGPACLKMTLLKTITRLFEQFLCNQNRIFKINRYFKISSSYIYNIDARAQFWITMIFWKIN